MIYVHIFYVFRPACVRSVRFLINYNTDHELTDNAVAHTLNGLQQVARSVGYSPFDLLSCLVPFISCETMLKKKKGRGEEEEEGGGGGRRRRRRRKTRRRKKLLISATLCSRP